jgi:hypothetical protein
VVTFGLIIGLVIIVTLSSGSNLGLLFLILAFNVVCLMWLGKTAIKHLLFPYGQGLIKFNYHQKMNLKMTKEIQTTIQKTLATLEHMSQNDFSKQSDAEK